MVRFYRLLLLFGFLSISYHGYGQIAVAGDDFPDPILEDSQATFEATENDVGVPALNKASIDFDQSTSGIQGTFLAPEGEWSANSDGWVTFVPAPNFSGEAIITYTIQTLLLVGTSNAAEITITVQPVNDPPVITAQEPLSTPEATAIAIDLSHLTVTDPDNPPADFTLTVGNGSNYSVSENTITPAPGFNGTLTVLVTVSDGLLSGAGSIIVTVTSVNTVPEITAQVPLSTVEETSRTLLVGNFTITDPDNTTFTLTVQDGANYTRSGNTITPNANFNGPLTVPVIVNDGTDNSAVFNATVTVTPVNDVPVITAHVPLSTPEATALTILVSNLTIVDPDNTTFTLAVQDGDDYTRSGNTITPNANFNGTLNVSVAVNDGTANSAFFTVIVTVSNVNSPPAITAQATLSTPEETALTLAVGNFTITDPDNTAFTLAVQDGANYTRSGNTITPNANFNGPLTVPVIVNDGAENSAVFDATVTVTAVNDVPVITAHVPLSTPEATALTILVSNLTIVDPDNTTFTLAVQNGDDYTRSGNTITPNANFNGTLTVPVIVNDGTANSAEFNVAVTVNNVNSVPVVTAQATLSTPEETALTLLVGNFTITDADNTTFTLAVQDGSNYTRSGNTITPNTNFNGTLTVPITVNDGTATSTVFNAEVAVTPINDQPVITAQGSLTTAEETPLTITVGNLVIADPDDNSFTLALQNGSNYTRSGNTITPIANFSGTLTVPATVSDGTASSPIFNLSVTVSNVNNMPAITAQIPLSTPEETALTLAVENFTITDPDNTTFTLSVQEGTNYSRSGNTITPSLNFNGVLTVPVTVNDGTSSSAVFNASVTVTPENDAPVITAQTPLGTPEATPLVIALSNLTITDPDNTTFTLSVQDGTNYARAENTITPNANFNGVLTVPVTVNDGTVNSTVFTLSVTVSKVNNVPVITAQIPLTTPEETALALTVSNVTISDPDNTTFTLSVLDEMNYTRDGNTITPAANFNGVLTVPVTVSDGITTSAPFNLSITVTPVNDRPAVTAQLPLTTPEEKPITLLVSNFTIADPDNGINDFKLKVIPGNYSISGTTVTPPLDFDGELSVAVTVSDGNLESEVFNVKIMVTDVNIAPVITGQTPATISIEINKSYLLTDKNIIITDPDSNQEDFILKVSPGDNYTLSGDGLTTVTPLPNFTGELNVVVRVSDGKADSPPFTLKINVILPNSEPLINAQDVLFINEDESLELTLNNLTVIDADDTDYPKGFTLNVNPGQNYSVSNHQITPTLNYFGFLTVPVTVNDGQSTSDPFDVRIYVTPVNDAPQITAFESVAISYEPGTGPISITEIFECDDVDNDFLSYAEVGLIDSNYNALNDELIFENTDTSPIRGIYDAEKGVLSLIGYATPEDYITAITSIKYNYRLTLDENGKQSPIPTEDKKIYINLHDGQLVSENRERFIELETSVELDIPNAFTPNSDGANDTWAVQPITNSDQFEKTIIRIYNKRGLLLYEATGLDKQWDGTFKGEILPVDTYYYIIDLQLSFINKTYKGPVAILH